MGTMLIIIIIIGIITSINNWMSTTALDNFAIRPFYETKVSKSKRNMKKNMVSIKCVSDMICDNRLH